LMNGRTPEKEGRESGDQRRFPGLCPSGVTAPVRMGAQECGKSRARLVRLARGSSKPWVSSACVETA